ncbi:MAG: hypothetical protein ACYDHY_14460 [Acidiferrobacterales bacterium]
MQQNDQSSRQAANNQPAAESGAERRTVPAVSRAFDDGTIVELLYQPKEQRTSFSVWRDGTWRFAESVTTGKGERLVPYSPRNNLIRHEVVLLPSEPEEYGTEEDLIRDIEHFIHRYVDVSPIFEKIAGYYVLFSWIFDGFNELPYLRLRGDYGSGKTRFLLTVGSLCYKPVFASGASTVSPIFHILDAFRGTLIIDEGDFRFSDEKAEIVKILNNGNVKGFPVLRTEVSANREFNPRAFDVYGPKLVATRGYYDDRALESRFLTEEMGQHRLRDDIPINLPSAYKDDALTLRNKLLLFRFRNLGKKKAVEGYVDRAIEPRLNQMFVPLMSIIDDAQLRNELHDIARRYHSDMVADRGMDIEAQVLEVIRDIYPHPDKKLSVKEITSAFTERYGSDYERKITPKWIGGIIRKKLHLTTQKSHGVFLIPFTEKPKLDRLYERYGIAPDEPHDGRRDGPQSSDFPDGYTLGTSGTL